MGVMSLVVLRCEPTLLYLPVMQGQRLWVHSCNFNKRRLLLNLFFLWLWILICMARRAAIRRNTCGFFAFISQLFVTLLLVFLYSTIVSRFLHQFKEVLISLCSRIIFVRHRCIKYILDTLLHIADGNRSVIFHLSFFVLVFCPIHFLYVVSLARFVGKVQIIELLCQHETLFNDKELLLFICATDDQLVKIILVLLM